MFFCFRPREKSTYLADVGERAAWRPMFGAELVLRRPSFVSGMHHHLPLELVRLETSRSQARCKVCLWRWSCFEFNVRLSVQQ